MTRAFVGISLDSRAFTRPWVRFALRHILDRHEHALLVLADELFVYTRMAEWAGEAVKLRVTQASSAAHELAAQRHRFFESEIGRLAHTERARVTLAAWSAYSDAVYARLWRRLWIAYSSLPRFRAAVDEVALGHAVRAKAGRPVPKQRELNVAYILDELAMAIRITEIAGYNTEYHPGPDLTLATALYAGRFAADGLSVEELIAGPARRKFIFLNDVVAAGAAADASASAAFLDLDF